LYNGIITIQKKNERVFDARGRLLIPNFLFVLRGRVMPSEKEGRIFLYAMKRKKKMQERRNECEICFENGGRPLKNRERELLVFSP
jgi:hypothetical protein